MRKGSVVVIVLVALVLILGGAVVFLFLQTKKSIAPANTSPTSQIQASPIVSPKQSPVAVDETASWKTYANVARKYSFKYPLSYGLNEYQKSQNQLESVYLKSKDIETMGDSQHSDVSKGASISFTVFDTGKDSYKNSLSQYGSNVFTNTTIGSKTAYSANIEGGRQMVVAIIPQDYGFINITFTSGFQDTQANQKTHLDEFNQILSTFQFTN